MLKQLCLIASMVVILCTTAVANIRPSREMVVSITDSITYCESRNQQDGVWGKAGEYGVAQFKPATFKWMSGIFHHPKYNITSREDQINLLQEAITRGYGNHWKVCYGKALTRVYAKLSQKRRTQMVATLLGTKSVDSIMSTFQKTIDELDSHRDKMYAEVVKQENLIVAAVLKKATSLREAERAKTIKIKLENLLV